MIGPHTLAAELVAVLVAVTDGSPRVLLLDGAGAEAPLLPSGPFEGADRSLQSSLRGWLSRRTGQTPVYVEQLYTFADRDRLRPGGGEDGGLGRVISVGYLALAREGSRLADGAAWHDWYDFFPWEDRRDGDEQAWRARGALDRFVVAAPGAAARRAFLFRDRDDTPDRWDEGEALGRYEMLWEAGLVDEHAGGAGRVLGRPLGRDHRRILATAIARIRAKIRTRALIFELMPPAFTLLALQTGMEGLLGRRLHKGNFRRLLAAQDLVEETGGSVRAGGRPARLYRFRGARLEERAFGATRLPVGRG